jgi:hypothetical protein
VSSSIRRWDVFRGHGDDRRGVYLGEVSAANPDDAWHAGVLSWGEPVQVRRSVGFRPPTGRLEPFVDGGRPK